MIILWVLLAYLAGSLTFAVFVCKILGLPDPRTYGSKNPGASNVLRSGSKPAAALTLLLDALKGFIPVLLVKRYGLDDTSIALVGLAAFLGHLYPIFFKFKGGKGVATAAGVIFAINPWLGVATLGTWLIVAFFFRYTSLAALIAAAFVPFYYFLGAEVAWNTSPSLFLALAVMSIMLIYAHRANIGRLIKGKEPKLGQKST